MSRRSGVITHRGSLTPAEVIVRSSRRMTSPARTFLDLAPHLEDVALIVLGDAVAARTGKTRLMAAVTAAPGRRGVAAARKAVVLVDPHSESPGETRTRLVLHAAGFTGLRHAVDVSDEAGGWLARLDLGDPVAKVGIQYDGLVHFDGGPERWRRDIDRDELARQEGWEIVVLTALDLRDPQRMIDKVAAAYARAAARRR